MKRERYPKDWEAISRRVKKEANWRCEVCGEPNSKDTWHILTTAHIIPIEKICERWNLIALCQRCHLGKLEPINKRLKVFRHLISDPLKEEERQSLKWYADLVRKELKVKQCDTSKLKQIPLSTQ